MFYREKDPDARITDTIAAIRSHPQCDSFDSSRADEDRQWGFDVRGSGDPGSAPRAEVAFIPFVNPYQDFKIIPWWFLASPCLDP